jgi:excisionase family DNA binding protein
MPAKPPARLEAALAEVEAAMAALQPAEVPAAIGSLEALRVRALERHVRDLQALQAPREDRLLTMPEVAARLKISLYQARDLGRRGEIPTVTVGDRFVRVRLSTLEEWIRRREQGVALGQPWQRRRA